MMMMSTQSLAGTELTQTRAGTINPTMTAAMETDSGVGSDGEEDNRDPQPPSLGTATSREGERIQRV